MMVEITIVFELSECCIHVFCTHVMAHIRAPAAQNESYNDELELSFVWMYDE